MTIITNLLLNFFCAFVSSAETTNPEFYLNFFTPGSRLIQQLAPENPSIQPTPYYQMPAMEYHRGLRNH